VSALKIAPDGMLSAVSGAAAQTTDGALACAVDPSGKFLFVVGRTASQLSVFAIDGSGALSGRQDTTVAADPVALVVHPKQNVLYVASAGGNAVSAFTYAASNGALTAAGSVTPGKVAAPKPMGLALSPDGKWLYSSNNADTVVNIWSVGATGALSAAGTADVLTGGRAVTADLGGAWLFVHTDDSRITVFDINSTSGALTAHANAIGGGTNPWADAIFHTGLKVK
jgi:6-phosphogluconolactonase (cycloisomerase 2 family)